jgi:hypothetical protein
MDQVEITGSFITEFGSRREPSPGQKFLWAHVQLKNTSQKEIGLPAPEHYSVLYAASEFKPSYGHRQGYPDYTSLGATLFPGQSAAAWLRFEIPQDAGLPDTWFVYLPESAQVGVSPTSAHYPWSADHPLFAWLCGK